MHYISYLSSRRLGVRVHRGRIKHRHMRRTFQTPHALSFSVNARVQPVPARSWYTCKTHVECNPEVTAV